MSFARHTEVQSDVNWRSGFSIDTVLGRLAPTRNLCTEGVETPRPSEASMCETLNRQAVNTRRA